MNTRALEGKGRVGKRREGCTRARQQQGQGMGERMDFYKVLFSGRHGRGDAVQMQFGVWSTEAWVTDLL